MTWHLPDGLGILRDAVAALFVASLASIYDTLLEEVDDGMEQWEFGVSKYDNLPWHQRLAMLVDVGEAMLREDVRPPELTAIREATVAAISINVKMEVEMEIDAESMVDELALSTDGKYWRRLVMASVEKDVLPLFDAEDADELEEGEDWEFLAEASLYDQLLWDADWDEDCFEDDDPAQGEVLKAMFGISRDYYTDIAPDPKREQIQRLCARMDALIASVPGDQRHYPLGFVLQGFDAD